MIPSSMEPKNISEDGSKSELEDILNIKQAENDDVELTVNEQIRRVQIILSGIASILLVNITAVVIVVTFDASVFIDVKFKDKNNFQTREKGNMFFLVKVLVIQAKQQ